MPVTKEVVKESRKSRHVKKLGSKVMKTHRTMRTPGPEGLLFDSKPKVNKMNMRADMDDYLQMTSEESEGEVSYARNAINRETFEQMNDDDNEA